MKKSLFLLLSILSICASLVYPANASAQTLSFAIKPENPFIGYFEFTMQPGDTVEDAIIILNHNEKKQTILVEPVDGFTANGGGITYEFSRNEIARQWINVEGDGSYELAGSRIQRLPFRLTVPPNTPPGEYVLGFLSKVEDFQATQVAKVDESGSGFGVKVVAQVGLAVIITVPGLSTCNLGVEDLVDSIQSAQWNLRYTLTNNANVHFNAAGDLIIKEKSSNVELLRQDILFGYIVPGTTFNYDIFMDLPENGVYEATLNLKDIDHPDCNLSHAKDIQVGEEIVEVYQAQSTRIAKAISTPTPTSPAQVQQVINEANTSGSPTWIIWLSITVFLFGAGLALYALSILKRHK